MQPHETPVPLQPLAELLSRAAAAPAKPPGRLAETVQAANAANAAGDFHAACALFDEAFVLSVAALSSTVLAAP